MICSTEDVIMKEETMQLGMIISHTDAETVCNALRLTLYSLEQGDADDRRKISRCIYTAITRYEYS